MTALWAPTPERIAQAGITDLMAHFNAKLGRSIHDYQGLHKLSVHEPESFGTVSGSMQISSVLVALRRSQTEARCQVLSFIRIPL